jgi:hypothetical protein
MTMQQRAQSLDDMTWLDKIAVVLESIGPGSSNHAAITDSKSNLQQTSPTTILRSTIVWSQTLRALTP